MSSYYSYTTTKNANDMNDMMKEIFSVKVMAAYGISMGPLAICFVCTLPSYLKAFRRNLTEHGKSSLLPLMTYSYRCSKVIYPMFLVLSIIAALMSTTKNLAKVLEIFLSMASMFALVISWKTSMYQVVISILTIYRFINSRQPIEFRGSVSRKHVMILMMIVFAVIIIKDLAFGFKLYPIMYATEIDYRMLNTVIWYYALIYMVYQILLFIGLAFQFMMKSDVTVGHSENCIARHIMIIGSVKLVLFIICGFFVLTGIETTIAGSTFFSVDFFLVPVVIQITEIRHNSNVIKTCEMHKEIQKEQLKV